MPCVSVKQFSRQAALSKFIMEWIFGALTGFGKCHGGNQRVLGVAAGWRKGFQLIQVRHSERDMGVPAPPAVKGESNPSPVKHLEWATQPHF